MFLPQFFLFIELGFRVYLLSLILVISRRCAVAKRDYWAYHHRPDMGKASKDKRVMILSYSILLHLPLDLWLMIDSFLTILWYPKYGVKLLLLLFLVLVLLICIGYLLSQSKGRRLEGEKCFQASSNWRGIQHLSRLFPLLVLKLIQISKTLAEQAMHIFIYI